MGEAFGQDRFERWPRKQLPPCTPVLPCRYFVKISRSRGARYAHLVPYNPLVRAEEGRGLAERPGAPVPYLPQWEEVVY